MPDSKLLPTLDQTKRALGLQFGAGRTDSIFKATTEPLDQFPLSSGKRLRSQLLEIGALFVQPQANSPVIQREVQERIERAARLVESLHAGSLIIDDIQDRSEVRRGRPTLHRKFGVSIALNAGNWLYFSALEQIAGLELDSETEREVYRSVHSTLLKAHFGQGFDLGTPMDEVPQQEAMDTCMASMELKTGALASMAITLGSLLARSSGLAGENRAHLTTLGDFGVRFGMALQMFDDIGNFNDSPPKRKEDLINRRPSWLWAVASTLCSPADYARFLDGVRKLPEESFIHHWAELHGLIPEARARASQFGRASIERLEIAFSADHPGVLLAEKLMTTLETSYG